MHILNPALLSSWRARARELLARLVPSPVEDADPSVAWAEIQAHRLRGRGLEPPETESPTHEVAGRMVFATEL